MDETLDNLGKTVADALAGLVIGYWVANGELTVQAAAGDRVEGGPRAAGVAEHGDDAHQRVRR